jgi:hypothetical protein
MDGVLPSVDDVLPDYMMVKTGMHKETRGQFDSKVSLARQELRQGLRGADALRHPSRAAAERVTGLAASSQGLT